MELPLYQIDAFAREVFRGNPAAVVPLEEWIADDVMQAIASENNLSETAFYVPRGADYALRWFTPVAEIDLAGHPTLATAHVIMNIVGSERDEVRFLTRRSGALTVQRDGDRLAMDFPARPPSPKADGGEVGAALGAAPVELHAARDAFAVFASEDELQALKPDFGKVARLDGFGLIATAPGRPGSGVDFVSRFFAPKHGVNEDPVTGSAHCTLIPYWAKRLGRNQLFARQISTRTGDLWCVYRGERVTIAGECAFYMEGRIRV